jgi:pimeloyl-ACP methyl ester carboxylesterase
MGGVDFIQRRELRRCRTSELRSESGLARIDSALIYYEIAGEGQPFVLIHAGVADSRQWNNEFSHFARRFRVLRYDMRGYGKSEPVDGEYSHLQDLTALLDYLHIDQPVVLMGCSIGGGLAMEFSLTQPLRVAALIMVDSNPRGLELDIPEPAKFEEAEKAYNAGDLDLLAEIETQIWFDGMGRTPAQVDPVMRQLAYEMNRHALSLDAKGLGKRLLDTQVPAVKRLSELHVPVLVIVGAQDIPYMQAAADYMMQKIPSARKETIEDAAHLANMDQPDEFRRVVTAFLDSVLPC